MANTQTETFDLENQAYQSALARASGANQFKQGDINKLIEQLKEKKDNTELDVGEKNEALKKWNELKNLNDAYQQFLTKKKNAEQNGLMAQFSFYPGKNKGQIPSIEFQLGDGTKSPLQITPKFSGISATMGENESYTVSMPLNSQMTVRYPDGPNGRPGETLRFSPGNKVEADFQGKFMSVDEFCKQTLANWEKNGKKGKIFLDFSSIPPDAQPEIKKKVAQTLMDQYADAGELSEFESRKGRREKILDAITDVSKDGKKPAFSKKDLEELGVTTWGQTSYGTRDTSYAEISEKIADDRAQQAILQEQLAKQRATDNFVANIVKAVNTSNPHLIDQNDSKTQDIKKFLEDCKEREFKGKDDFEKHVKENWNVLIKEDKFLSKGYEIPVDRLWQAYKEVRAHQMAESQPSLSNRNPLSPMPNDPKKQNLNPSSVSRNALQSLHSPEKTDLASGNDEGVGGPRNSSGSH